MQLRPRTNITKNNDPLRIGSYNYNLGIKNKTELQTIYRQLCLNYLLPAFKSTFTRQRLIGFIMKEPVLCEFFKVEGKPTHANKDALRLNQRTDGCLLSDENEDFEYELENDELSQSSFIEEDTDKSWDSEATYETESDIDSDDFTEDDCSDEDE